MLIETKRAAYEHAACVAPRLVENESPAERFLDAEGVATNCEKRREIFLATATRFS